MNAQLNYMMVKQRSADLRRAAEGARLATEVPEKRRSLRDHDVITRPTADPGRATTPTRSRHFLGHQLTRHGLLPPTRLRIGDGREREERHSSWLELFFDLVFVAAVGQLAGALQHAPTTGNLLRFIGLFIPVWWTWLTFSIYADRHEAEDDPVHRAAYLLAALFGVGLAIGADQAIHGHVGAFLVAFLALRVLQMGLWARAGRQVPAVARLYRRHLITFGAGGLLWAASLAVSSTILPALWAAALAVELAGPVTAVRKRVALPLNPVHLTERLEIFVLIVLGESVTRLVGAATQRAWTSQLAIVLAAAFATITSLWWISLRVADHRPIARGPGLGNLAYRFLYLPIVLSIAAASAGLHVAILAASGGTIGATARTALYGGTGVFLLAAAALPAGPAGWSARLLRLGAAGASLALVPMGSVVAPVWLVPALTAILIAEIAIETKLARQSQRPQPEPAAARISHSAPAPAPILARANHDSIFSGGPEQAASPARG